MSILLSDHSPRATEEPLFQKNVLKVYHPWVLSTTITFLSISMELFVERCSLGADAWPRACCSGKLPCSPSAGEGGIQGWKAVLIRKRWGKRSQPWPEACLPPTGPKAPLHPHSLISLPIKPLWNVIWLAFTSFFYSCVLYFTNRPRLPSSRSFDGSPSRGWKCRRLPSPLEEKK